MGRPGIGRSPAALVAVVAVLGVVATEPALAGNAASGAEGPLDVTGWVAVGVLLVGTAILLASVELLVHALVRTALQFRVSAFLLAVVFSGLELDNVAFGVFTGFRELQNVSFGLAIGNAVSIFGLVLAVGVLAYPFEIDVPREYLLLMVVGPFVLLPFVVAGAFVALGGGLLVALSVVVFGYVYRCERESDRTFMRADEVREVQTVADGDAVRPRYVPAAIAPVARRSWFWPAALVVALVGVVVGAEGSSAGVEGILTTWDLGGTFLGVTLVTVLYTLDDLLLAVEPLRLGYYDVAVGGVIGSLLFFVTANVGIVALVGTVHVSRPTLYVHFPALVGMTTLAGYFLWRGRLRRWHGGVLLGLYATYLLVNVVFLSTLPIGG